MATTVVNRKRVRGVAPPFDVDIGRGDPRFGRWAESDWHTPFELATPTRKGDGTREDVVGLYLTDLHCARPDLLARVGELRGKPLACWCVPELCHGQILAALADATAA